MALDQRARLLDEIRKAEAFFERPAYSVALLAVSKGQEVARLLSAYAFGQRAFGENYVQEALPKIQALQDKNIEWHFIGPIQTNKTRAIAAHFDWVHTVSSVKVAERLSAQRPHHLAPQKVCIQVNISCDPHKSGVLLSEVPELARALSKLPNLTLRGLMCLPTESTIFEEQRVPFSELRQTLQTLNGSLNLNLDTLSMGMSYDFKAAIAEGATLVRMGRAFFEG